MMILEIRVNSMCIERITAQNMWRPTPSHTGIQEKMPDVCTYNVNGVIEITHKRSEGHRALARKMLDAVKKFKQ